MLPLDAAFLDGVYHISGQKAIERIMNHPDPPRLIRNMSSEDFWWLIKKVGAESSVDLLEMATAEQWQYILDVELWRNDRLETARAGQWLMLLAGADAPRLVKWLFSEGQGLAYWFFNQSVELGVIHGDEVYDVKPDFFTLDGLFYVKVNDDGQREVIEKILRTMADEDLLKYQALLTGLSGVLPAELEEDMYRMRNIRLAEHGFLPREEAVAVYAPLKSENLNRGDAKKALIHDAGTDLVVRRSLQLVQGENFFSKALTQIEDVNLLDRIRLEFAGLCNQIASADGLSNRTEETFQKICFRAANYLNLILTERCKDDTFAALKFLENNSLLSLFRAGFGLVINLKRRAETWLKKSWFHGTGFDAAFWGESWGSALKGLLQFPPQFYRGDEAEKDYGEFESLSDLESVSAVLDHVLMLDRLMGALTNQYGIPNVDSPFDLTIHSLLMTLWAREMLNTAPGFEPITVDRARMFLSFLRVGETHPPYRMFGFEEQFVAQFSRLASTPENQFLEKDMDLLKHALSQIWSEFSDEMEQMPLDRLQSRYSRYLLITPDR